MHELKKLREELQVKSSNLQDLFQQSKTTPDGSIDLSKVERFGDVSVKGKSSSELPVLIDNANTLPLIPQGLAPQSAPSKAPVEL